MTEEGNLRVQPFFFIGPVRTLTRGEEDDDFDAPASGYHNVPDPDDAPDPDDDGGDDGDDDDE